MMLGLILFMLAGLAVAKHELFEGDIVLDEYTSQEVKGRLKYDARKDRKWPQRTVPYTFHKGFDKKRRNLVHEAIREFEKHTCVQWIPRTSERGYVEFYFGRGCSSTVGRRGNIDQGISIGQGCLVKGKVIHEMMHAIGFYHEQSRLDRDDNIIIHWKNITKGWESNFEKYSHGEADFLDEPYDLDSIMHYPKTAFGNGKITIESKKYPTKVFGQRIGFSKIDIRQINKLYYCDGTKPLPIPTTKPPPGCVDKDPSCSKKAQGGMCKQWWAKDFMKRDCKLSCKFC